MALTQHDAEERMRPLLGRVYDARETYAEIPNKANAEAVIHRLEEALAQSQENVRQAVQ